jgi:cytochrome c peroxidase
MQRNSSSPLRALDSERLSHAASPRWLRHAATALAAGLLLGSATAQRQLPANGGNAAGAAGGSGASAPAVSTRVSHLPPALSAQNVPLPSNLYTFVKDFDAAVRLGKAFFWDIQAGSDGMTACATCHWHAGADARAKSQLAPGHDNAYQPMPTGAGGVNYEVTSGDFPFTERADPNAHDSVLVRDLNDRLSSAGIQHRTFDSVTPGVGQEQGTVVPDSPFSLGGLNVARVEPRNTPTVINAIFNVRTFWDGRAQEKFNGVNNWGDLDPNARVLELDSNGQLNWVSVLLDKAALASQAVGPALSADEMSYQGKSFQELGRKMLTAAPLAGQFIDSTDVHFGFLSAYPARGMQSGITYADLVRAAFHDAWHNGSQQVNGYSHMENNFSLYWGIAILCYESQLVSDDAPYDRFIRGDASALTAEQLEGLRIFNSGGAACNVCHFGSEYAGATWNHVAQFGAVERMATLGTIATDTLKFTTVPDITQHVLTFDPRGAQVEVRTPAGAVVALGNVPGSQGNCSIEDLDAILQLGPAAPVMPTGGVAADAVFEVHVNARSRGQQLPNGLCNVDFTVSMRWGQTTALPPGNYPVFLSGAQVGVLAMGVPSPDGIYDLGYYNIGVRPWNEDIGSGGHSPFGPLSLSERLKIGDPTVQQWMPAGGVQSTDRTIVRGAFKTPSLRNIALTGPYFHNGGAGTLEQVVQFYARGADFAEFNALDLDEAVDGVGSIRNKQAKQAALVAFMRDALLDDRVTRRAGVFCAPSLPLKDGYDGNEVFVVDNGLGEAVSTINELPQTGAAGGAPLRPFADMLPGGINVLHEPTLAVQESMVEGCGTWAVPTDFFREVHVYLTNQPTGPVTIDVSVSDATELLVEPAQLVFDSVNWFHPQVIRVSGVADGVVDATQMASVQISAATSSDARYNGLGGKTLSVSVQDSTLMGNQLFVDGSNNAVLPNGSAGRPFRRISDALACASPGMLVLVAPGTYHENVLVQGRDIVIEGFGATIDGGLQGPCVTVFGAQTQGTVLRGLTLVNGGGQNSEAGALYVSDSTSVTVDGCVLADSQGMQGGGAFARNSSHLTVIDSVIERNVGQQRGGGLFIDGGSLTFANSIVWDNSTQGEGGGIALQNMAHLNVDGGIVMRNSAGQRAGGILMNGGLSDIYNLSVSFNTASQGAGGMLVMNSASIVAHGFKLANNSAQNGVGGLFVDGGQLELRNATLADNSAEELWVMNNCSLTIASSVLWDGGSGNAIGSNMQQPLPALVQHSIVDSTRLAASGYSQADPLFEGAASGNHNLLAGSPGENGGDPAEVDLDGSRVDIGAHQIVGN